MTEYTKPQRKIQAKTAKQLHLFERRKDLPRRRLTEHDYRRVCVYRDVVWIGETPPKTSRIKTKWRCKVCNHIFHATYNSVQQGSGCPRCGIKARSDKRRLTKEDYRKVGESRTVEWVGNTLPPNTDTKSLWRCKTCGHKWMVRYHDIVGRHSGCPPCGSQRSNNSRRLTAEDYTKVGLYIGIYWLGDVVPNNTHTYTLWGCSQGHIFKTTHSNIAHAASRSTFGCTTCALDHQRLSVDDYINAGLAMGVKWIGDTIPQTHTHKTQWKCIEEGHFWTTSYRSIVINGSNCPRCQNMVNGVQVSTQQEWLCDLVAGELNIYHEDYCLDITTFIDGVNIAIEYDGWYWHKEKVAEDAKRDQDLIAAGWRVLRVKSGELLPDKQDVLAVIKRLLNGSTYEEIILDDWGKG